MIHPTGLHRSCGAARRGFTVVEVLVALIVVAVGLLGVAGTSALALRASNAAMREQSAVSRATSRLAVIAADGCGSAASGERHVATGLAERWVVGPLVNGTRLVDASADWDDTGRRRTVTLRSALLC